MFKLSVAICFLIALAVESAKKELREFHFTKVKDVKNEFNFEYIVNGVTLYSGKTTPLSEKVPGLYLMVGPDAQFFWVKLTNDQLKQDSFDELVRPVEFDTQHEVLADLKDEFCHYKLYNNGRLTGGTYNADWDLDNIIFTLADSRTKVFDYTISSKNNNRQIVGRTSHDDDPHVQKVLVPDHHQCYSFQAIFTDDELRSSKEIHKKVIQVLRCTPLHPVRATTPVYYSQVDIEPVLFRNLISLSRDEY
ncbi:uncharacterized protein LOC129565652 [Sitodiplosis mosellana]|uniref:uncharacterized protein LOC129565652 n=1 Tax=Sitodiplosis mosellana TaxID=263140 RepID=UPI002444E003|nr:uncharacterized protein LOC129565652 [Sitodiplosis mosellana]